MRLLSGWALPLRIARRDALRHRGRSVLTLVMIALPVLAVTTADVLIQTSEVSGPESVERRMGAAAALISVNDGITSVEQGPDPERDLGANAGEDGAVAPSAEQVSSLLDGARLLSLVHSQAQVATDEGRTDADVTEVDLRDPVTDGLFDLTSGRLPRAPGEVVVNQALADEGYAVGDRLDLTGDDAPADPRVVGIAESTTVRSYPVAAGPVGSLVPPETQSATWLVDGAPVPWSTVQQLNAIGATVTSRAVIDDPPPPSQWPSSVYRGGVDSATVAVLVLVVVMALIEVVLLAGPAFAVGARKQQRSLALLVATGGTPAQSRRVVIGSAIVLGSVAAVSGVVAGIGLARLVQPVLQRLSSSWFGPFDVPWLHLLGIAAFGLLSAFLAAVVPAWLASRQDVVAVLAGRRGDRPASYRSPLLGLVLLGVGVAGSVVGARGGGEYAIAASAIPTVLGMILVVPLVLTGLARVSGRLPLALRYAARDAARHRTRTVPAVAAVAATVAGVVAIGIGLSSDTAEQRGTYSASLPSGVGMVTAYGTDATWSAIRSAVERELPGATLAENRGLADVYEGDTGTYTEAFVSRDEPVLSSSGATVGAAVMVSDDALPAGLVGLADEELARGAAALRSGRAVGFYDGAPPVADAITVAQQHYDNSTGRNLGRTKAQVPVTWLPVRTGWVGPSAVVPSTAAEAMGTAVSVVSLVVTGTSISEDEQSDLSEALLALTDDANLYVERGYQVDDDTLIVQLVLLGLGAVLMLGGTLTATFLALSDARPDLATLAAVGASPRTRRGVAASYAVVVGLVGTVLGAAIGFVPGLAVTWPLTTSTGSTCLSNGAGGVSCTDGAGTGPFIDVPWLMVLALVVVLPLVAALAVGLFSRSRLPLVARLD